MPNYSFITHREWNALQRSYEILKGALEDIITADETSTLKGAVAIARHALEEEQRTGEEVI